MNQSKRRFKIEYNWWEAVLEIDEDKAAETLKEVVEFWYDWERVLARHQGDYASTFCWYISPLLIDLSRDSGLDWIREEGLKNEEGYCMTLNGDNGIELVAIDEWAIDHDDVAVIEMKGGQANG